MSLSRKVLFSFSLLVTTLICVFLVLPIGITIFAALTRNYMEGLSGGFTLQWITEVWGDYKGTIGASVFLALGCLMCTSVIGVPAAYLLARSKSYWARLAEELLVLPLAVPGIAIALSLIVTYGGFIQFRQGWGIILVGHIIYTLPFMVRSVLAVMSSIGLRTLEEGAASLGAGFVRRFFTVILPNCRGGIVAGALMVLTLSIGEFNITLLLYTPDTNTLPVGLNNVYATSRLEVSSAYTSLFLVIIIPLLMSVLFATQSRKLKARRLPKSTVALASAKPPVTLARGEEVRA